MNRPLACVSVLILLASMATAQECRPPCRPGFTCIDGACVSLCNPPCREGERCDPKLGDCVPMAPASSSSSSWGDESVEINDEVEGAGQIEEGADYPSHDMQTLDEEDDDGPDYASGGCAENSQCTPSELCVGGTCREYGEVRDAGSFGFAAAAAFYGIGVSYCSIAPIIWGGVGYDSEYGYDGFVIAANGPQKSLVVLPGLGCQLAILKQRHYLRELRARKLPAGLFTASWALYALAAGSSALNMIAFASDNEAFGLSTSIANVAILASSFTVSVVVFTRQRNLLRTTVMRADATGHGASVCVVPYLSIAKDRMDGGVSFGF